MFLFFSKLNDMIVKVENMKKYCLSFIIPILILFFCFLLNDIILGDYSSLISDSQLQYQQLLLYLKRCFEGNASFLYTFEVGFGTPFVSTMAYYLMSPLNILTTCFSAENIEICFLLLCFIKIGLCGTTMYSYLNYNFKSNHLLLFSTSYALSFYIVANYFQIMWLDAYFLAPLLLLGIDKFIQERKHILYSIILFLTILTNYYMGFMCCIFSLLYFFYKYLLSNNKNKKTILNFLIISLLSGLMTMFLHLPNLLELIKIPRNLSRDYLFNIDIFGTLSKLFIGSNVEGGAINEYHPYLYIGIFNLVLLLFYFANQKIAKKEKLLSLIFIIILVLSIIIVPLNNFWHAFSNPIGFNFRYIYLFNIFIISLCTKSFINLKQVDLKWYYVCFLIIIIMGILVVFRNIMNSIYIYASVILTLLYLIIFRRQDKDIKILFFILVFSELFFNSFTVLNAYDFTYRKAINGRYKEKMSAISNIVDDGFYRIEFENKNFLNEPLYYDYDGVTGWLSSAQINSDYYNNIGYYSYNNLQLYNHYLLLDSLFGIKYYGTVYQYDYYELLAEEDISTYGDMLYGNFTQPSYLYKNPYALSLGYMVENKVKEPFLCSNPFDCQNETVRKMINQDRNIYEIEEISGEMKIKIKDTSNFYVLFIEDIIDVESAYNVCVDQKCFIFSYNSNKSIYTKNQYKIGDTIDVAVGENGYIEKIYVGYFDFDFFAEAIQKLKTQQLKITDFKGNYIKGNIEVTKDNVLFLSIPYNKNFKILVDGKETNYYQVLNNFIGLDLTSGYHEIEIIYCVKGLKLGLFISFIALVLMVFYSKRIKLSI